MNRHRQSWVAECQWNGRKQFWCGTFFTDASDGIESARREASKTAVDFFRDILPVEVAPPDHIRLVPGALILELEE